MNTTINITEFGAVVVGLISIVELLKRTLDLPPRIIPLFSWVLGVIAYQAISNGWADGASWVEAVIASATATGVHSGLKNTARSGSKTKRARSTTGLGGTLTLLCVLCALSVSAIGCKSFRAMTPEQKAAEVKLLATDAASIGTMATLQWQPQYRPAFEAAYLALDNQLSSPTPITLETIRQVLATLPIEELRGTEVAIAVQGARLVFRRVSNGETDEEVQLYARALATGIRDGMREGLGW